MRNVWVYTEISHFWWKTSLDYLRNIWEAGERTENKALSDREEKRVWRNLEKCDITAQCYFNKALMLTCLTKHRTYTDNQREMKVKNNTSIMRSPYSSVYGKKHAMMNVPLLSHDLIMFNLVHFCAVSPNNDWWFGNGVKCAALLCCIMSSTLCIQKQNMLCTICMMQQKKNNW